MRICFAGSHSTGKTTILNLIRESNVLADHEFITEITRGMAKDRVNLNGDNDSQIWIFNEHLRLSKNDNCIMDRSIFDPIAYAKYLYINSNKISFQTLQYGSMLKYAIVPSYDIIFYIPIEIPLVDDGFRESTDYKFRDWIDKEIKRSVEEFQKEYKLVEISGTISERINKCISTIQEIKEAKEKLI